MGVTLESMYSLFFPQQSSKSLLSIVTFLERGECADLCEMRSAKISVLFTFLVSLLRIRMLVPAKQSHSLSIATFPLPTIVPRT